ncbi:MAG: hypothetical protein J0H01_10480 [Rhizobiales bacterium]|nr:hypothetical protein [Hyphomicrobiales bacterium]
MSPLWTMLAAPLLVSMLAGAYAETLLAPAAQRPPAADLPRGMRPESAKPFCADRRIQPVIGLTCGATDIVDPPSFRTVARPCILEIDGSGEPEARDDR